MIEKLPRQRETSSRVLRCPSRELSRQVDTESWIRDREPPTAALARDTRAEALKGSSALSPVIAPGRAITRRSGRFSASPQPDRDSPSTTTASAHGAALLAAVHPGPCWTRFVALPIAVLPTMTLEPTVSPLAISSAVLPMTVPRHEDAGPAFPLDVLPGRRCPAGHEPIAVRRPVGHPSKM